MLLPSSNESTVSTMIKGNRCFRTARTSSNVIKGVVISEVSFFVRVGRARTSPRPQNHGGSARQEPRAARHSAGVGHKSSHPQACSLGHAQGLAFLVVFKNMVSLRRLEGGAE